MVLEDFEGTPGLVEERSNTGLSQQLKSPPLRKTDEEEKKKKWRWMYNEETGRRSNLTSTRLLSETET